MVLFILRRSVDCKAGVKGDRVSGGRESIDTTQKHSHECDARFDGTQSVDRTVSCSKFHECEGRRVNCDCHANEKCKPGG